MLVKCNPSCRDNGGMTDASLDIKSNCVVCNVCGEDLNHISNYTKASMKRIGDVIRRKDRKAFTFSCNNCGEKREIRIVDNKAVGHDCDHKSNECNFLITQNMLNAVKIFGQTEKEGVDDE